MTLRRSLAQWRPGAAQCSARHDGEPIRTRVRSSGTAGRDWENLERGGVDVFVSYAHDPDQERALALGDALAAEGLVVWLDREIETFASISAAIENRLARSKALVVFYSHAYPARRACQWELTAAFLAAQRGGDNPRSVLVVNPEPGIWRRPRHGHRRSRGETRPRLDAAQTSIREPRATGRYERGPSRPHRTSPCDVRSRFRRRPAALAKREAHCGRRHHRPTATAMEVQGPQAEEGTDRRRSFGSRLKPRAVNQSP